MNVGVSERREMVDKGTTGVSIKRQCNLLGINRSGFYYQAIPESELNLLAMRLMDAYFMDHPHTGVESMWGYLVKSEGLAVNQKRIRRLLRLMGLMALYPKKKLSTPGGEGHNYYPYLLRGLKIERVDQVWETDITYIPMKKGFMYMMAVIDVKSRYVLQWDISPIRWMPYGVQKCLKRRYGSMVCPKYSIPTRAASLPLRCSWMCSGGMTG
jgi:putative transposase